MGCTSSIPDPNHMYGSEHKNISTQAKESFRTNENNNNTMEKRRKEERNRSLRGDLSQYTDARHRREKRLRDSLLNREIMAKEMSDRVMEEKERLSLTSSRSRATSPRSGRLTTRSTGDVALTSQSTVSFATNENDGSVQNLKDKSSMRTILENKSNAKQNGSVCADVNQNGGVHWKDQSESSTDLPPPQKALRSISAITEKSEEGTNDEHLQNQPGPFSTAPNESHKEPLDYAFEEQEGPASPLDPGQQLYPGHQPTSLLQKSLLSVGAAAVAITRPWRDDMVATLGETTGYYALTHMRTQMRSHPVGRQILEERPRINSGTVSLDYLRSLPDGTFGKVYINFLDTNKVTPDSRRDVMFVDDPELAYVMQRYREVHDLLHTLLGMPTNMLGEVVVKWFEAIQTGLPMCVTGAMFGPVRLRQKHMRKYLDTHLWWAINTGRNAECFMNVYYEHEWETPLHELREKLNIGEPPATPMKKRTH